MRNEDAGILLVEGDDVEVMKVRRAFRQNNFHYPLYIAENGVDALEILRGKKDVPLMKSPPKIVLLDLNMPKMNGIEFLRELRADPELKRTVVVVLTTSKDERDVLSAY